MKLSKEEEQYILNARKIESDQKKRELEFENKGLKRSEGFANVRVFNKTKECYVTMYGNRQDCYEGDQLLFISREEDAYAFCHYIDKGIPFCTVNREDFNRGRTVEG